MLWIKKFFGRKEPISLDEAIEVFKAAPAQWFCSRGGPMVWPERDPESESNPELPRPIHPPDMAVIVDGHSLGYVENVSCISGKATIGHIAVAKELAGRGIGPVMARAYAAELARRYGVESIVFSESSTRYHEARYPDFFKRIGATPMAIIPHRHRADRPDYLWMRSSWT